MAVINKNKKLKELKKIKKGYKYFTKNKLWIVSALYVFAIVKDYVWYATFGVNILSYVSIQDTFISFLNHTIILVVLTINYFLFQLLFSKNKKNLLLKIIKYILIIGTSIVYFALFKKPMSMLSILIFVLFIHSYYLEKKYNQILFLALVFLIGFSTVEPLTQGIIMKRSNTKKSVTQFSWEESNMDYYSFNYENKLIDTELEKYYLIGNTKDYFFIFDKEINKTLIINKIDCKNIIARFKVLGM